MLIAQISDSHYRSRGIRLFGAVDTHDALTRAIDFLTGLEPAPIAVIHTGDVTNDGDEADHAALAGLFSRLGLPLHVVPGNHDDRDLLRRHLGGTAVPEQGPIRHDIDLGPVRLIGLDSLVEGRGGGRLGAAQLDWLDTALTGAAGQPVLLFLHHPPFATGIGFMDDIMLEDHAALAEIVARHRQVQLVTCGHVHRSVQTRFAGTIATIAPAISHQVALDFTPGAPPRWVAEPPAVMLHRWTREWGFVSHVAYVDEYGKPASFVG